MDVCDTLPMDQAVESADAEPSGKPGDIPEPHDPPLEVLEGVRKQLQECPPEGFDPKLQHKKQFREMVKAKTGGQ